MWTKKSQNEKSESPGQRKSRNKGIAQNKKGRDQKVPEKQMNFSHLAANVSRAQGGAGVGGDFAGGGGGGGRGGGEGGGRGRGGEGGGGGEGARIGVGGGEGGGGGGKSDGCVVDPGSRSNARSVAPGHQSLQESLLVERKGPGSRTFQGSPGTFEGQSGPLEGPPGTLVGTNDTLAGSFKALDSQEEEFERVEVAMADLTLSRTPHSLKKVINND